jgi:predicted lipoprotein with Yx(FWY)xxD motif
MHLGRAIAAPLLIAALVAACSGTPASTPQPTVPATAAPASAAPASAPPAAASPTSASGGAYGGAYGGSGASPSAAAGDIALASAGLGTVLVGPTGMTLYMFTPDTASASACTGSCAATWPPLTGAVTSLGAGLNASDFGTLTRSDGTTQITFHGHPLYYFSGDQAPGDTNGQGLAGKWYVLGADGNAIK